MAYNYLEDHALKNVWCAPGQDKQSITQPARVTPFGGAWNYVKVGWRTHTLPLQGIRMHVYMVGQLHPTFMGLFPQQYQWVNLSDAMNAMHLIADLYTDQGECLPRFEMWYMVDADRNLILAVRDPKPNLNLDLNTQALYFRVYTNAFYQSLRGMNNPNGMQTAGQRIGTTAQILTLQAKFQQLQGIGSGLVYAFVNGYKVETIDLFTCKVGDVVEYIYDPSIYKVVTWSVADLKTFDSLLDLKTKYLLHYAGAMDNQIDYHDDIDFFLVNPSGVTTNRYKGIYMHRNGGDTIRMVTHRDYSVVVPYLVTWAGYQNWADLNGLHIRMHVRYGGLNRGLVFEDSRIQELYKMQDADILNAMLGTQSTVSVWRADYLENSAYTALMRNPVACLPQEQVEAAYGYNAISKLVGNTPAFTRDESQQTVVDVPYLLQQNAVAYEYDAQGHLMGFYQTPGGSIYACANTNAALVEMIAGVGDTQLDELYGTNNITLAAGVDYRMYTCPITNGVPSNIWTDVTGSANYVIINGVLQWTIDQTKFYTLLRGNRNVLAYTLQLTPSEGVLEFSLTQRMRRQGTISTFVMQIPMGELVLHLNGHPLIENIDYFVVFPKIVIVNKAYLSANPVSTPQQIDIRFSGHCKSDQTRENTEDDRGFVVDGLLSANNRFDLRDDKVLRIVVGGALKDRSQLEFAETDTGVGGLSASNGLPYLIRDIVVPMRTLTQSDTYTMRAHSLAIDQMVGDYLSSKIPEPALPQPIVIPALYRLYSPFLSKIIYDLKAGILNDERLYGPMSTALAMQIVQPYEYLLAFDPSQQNTLTDPNFTAVDPTNVMTVIQLDAYQYRLAMMVAKQYCPTVSLSQFVSITPVAQAS
jgi:hypothetical protein